MNSSEAQPRAEARAASEIVDELVTASRKRLGQLTLPDNVRKAAKLEEGDLLEAVVSDTGEVILRPLATIDRSQAWFWTPEWQAGEREATEQVRRGDRVVFKTDEDFLDSLG